MKSLLENDAMVYEPPELGSVLCLSGLPAGGAYIHDKSPYGNHGLITGAVWKKLMSGLWCLDFDGVDDFVNVAADDSFDITTGDITIMLWFRADTVSRECDLLQKWASGGSYTIYCNSANRIFFIKQGDSGSEVYATTTIQAGRWYFIVCQKVSGAGKIFFNGILEATDVTFANFNTGGDLTIGKGGDGKFDGQIALPRIDNRALSALEIQNAFNREKSLFGVW